MNLFFKLSLAIIAIAVILIIHQIDIIETKIEMLKEEIENVRRIYGVVEMKEGDNK